MSSSRYNATRVARTISDFNREYLYRCWVEEVEAARRPQKGRIIKSAAFYLMLTTVVLLAFFYAGNDEQGKRFGPFSYHVVLTNSMQSAYPQGSLIFSWAIRPGDSLAAGLAGGDDIVFVKEDGMLVVHRIIEVMPNYENSGMRAFKTQGTESALPDSWITFEGNVVGRVMGHIPVVGNFLIIIADNILWMVAIIIVICVIITLLKIAFAKEENLARNNLTGHESRQVVDRGRRVDRGRSLVYKSAIYRQDSVPCLQPEQPQPPIVIYLQPQQQPLQSHILPLQQLQQSHQQARPRLLQRRPPQPQKPRQTPQQPGVITLPNKRLRALTLRKCRFIACTPSCGQFPPALPAQTPTLLQVVPPLARTNLGETDPQSVVQAINRHFP